MSLTYSIIAHEPARTARLLRAIYRPDDSLGLDLPAPWDPAISDGVVDALEKKIQTNQALI